MKYKEEGMDCRKLLLCFWQKLWIAACAALVGALLGGGIYLFVHVVINSNREYQAESKIKLDFAPDETGEAYQAYNGYTWNDLMSTDAILDTTMSCLPDTYTEEEVVAATSALILSDIRLLTIRITADSPDKTAEILQATDQSLVTMGEREKEFYSITILKETEPKLLAADPRLLQAVLIGLVLALASALLAMALVFVLEDKIYIPGDLKCVTDLPFVGFTFTEPERAAAAAGSSKRAQELFKKLQTDLKQNRAYLSRTVGRLVTIPGTRDALAETDFDSLREADGILLAVPYRQMSRTALNYQIEQFTLQECKLTGILIQDADMRFLRWYYSHL